MSAVAVAPLARRPRTRTLSVVRLTPEEELEQLVAEQERDDTYCVYKDPHVVSLDAPTPDGKSTIHDLIGVCEDGEVVHFIRDGFYSRLYDPRSVPHGTLGGYNNHKCRCFPCRGAIAEYRRQRRAEQ